MVADKQDGVCSEVADEVVDEHHEQMGLPEVEPYRGHYVIVWIFIIGVIELCVCGVTCLWYFGFR
jgi:hypothetical protein